MKNVIKNKTKKAFTLLEMLVVLLIIGVLILLFIPNLSKQRETIDTTGNKTIVKVVETQTELYLLNNPDKTSMTAEELENDGYITDDQLAKYNQVK